MVSGRRLDSPAPRPGPGRRPRGIAPTRRRLLLGLGGLAAVAAAVSVAAPRARASGAPSRRFLLIYSAHSTLAANMEASRGVAAVLDRGLGADYEIYAEYRDDQRFPGAGADGAFAGELARKYRGERFDAVLAFGAWALRYAAGNRDTIGPATPVVFGGVGPEDLAALDPPPGIHGVAAEYSVPGTLALARALQPGADRVVVLSGSGEFDRSWEGRARASLAGVTDIPVTYVSGLTMEGFAEVAAGLDDRAILIILTIYRDAAGARFTPANAAEIIAARSAAPAYGVYDTYIGRGVVGGEVQRFRDVGAAMAEQALRLVRGEPAPRLAPTPSRPVVDWRALRRFGLAEAALPPGTMLEFYDPPFWDRYRTQVLVAGAIILAQSLTIAGLVLQDRRRRAAERETASHRAELAHMSRVAQLGELSGAMAHELNQPLTAILANAEAGAQLVARGAGESPVDLAEIAEIFADIAEDDRRAAEMIVALRQLMAKGETEFEPLELNTVVADTLRLSRSELLVREVAVETMLARGELPVRANRIQLRQVLLNLMLNAADAMADLPAPRRVITIATRARADGWRELSVRDRGPGLAAEVAADPFRPFATTKTHGLGLGLSICQTIAEAHGGTLRFEDPGAGGGTGGGARAVLALPAP
ncbi:sensor histidine kinase [Amaricoccus solimangrovi]|uniref:histidine kinase n=1 Tax=Amaricoccus solimangrovi TaxID=2589815 RepID=A0A501WFT0_9RHOB|nr:ATP-binding protein [Amaricoccus solimangrovi]TPE46944.1 histidine kinase [Amaricoccus solimangrovi]